MTQLVELQAKLERFEKAGIKVYAISYDSPEAIAAFAAKHDVSYDLLSDQGSAVIKKFGILNTLIQPGDANAERFHGIPFPGTYVLDEAGVVTEKFFNRHYATRTSAGTILDTALGEALIHDESPQTEFGNEQVEITAFLSDSDLKLEAQRTLIVRFQVANGLHVYGEPLPDGFFATSVDIEPAKGVRIGQPQYPATQPLEFPKLAVTLPVYEGSFDVSIPVTANHELLNWNIPHDTEAVQVEVVVNYQACSDTVCYQPQSTTLALDLPLEELVRPGR